VTRQSERAPVGIDDAHGDAPVRGAASRGLIALVDELAAVNDATGFSLVAHAAPTLAAFQGREVEAAQLIEVATNEVMRGAEGQGLTFIQWATAVLYNGLGRYAEALAAAKQAAEDTLESRLSTWGLVELIEAAARSGKPELATDALDRLSQTTASVEPTGRWASRPARARY